jgi:hypothetical protein
MANALTNLPKYTAWYSFEGVQGILTTVKQPEVEAVPPSVIELLVQRFPLREAVEAEIRQRQHQPGAAPPVPSIQSDAEEKQADAILSQSAYDNNIPLTKGQDDDEAAYLTEPKQPEA